MRVILSGGGSGGHIYPALTIARGLMQADSTTQILYVGTTHGLERELVPRENIAFRTIHAQGLLVSGLAGKASGVLAALRGLFEAFGIICVFKPDVVVGTGGYVSGPVGLAASLLGIPLVIQEQNAWPGLTNRSLAKRAATVFVPFEEAVPLFPPKSRIIVAGNPVERPGRRAGRDAVRVELGLDPKIRVLMVTGGSQGAVAVNDVMLELLLSIAEDSSLGLVWATGTRYYASVMDKINKRFPQGLDPNRIRVVEYFYRIASMYEASNLFLGRGGAMTLTDCEAFGLPMVIVPSPNVSEDHQTRNAEAVARRGAGVVIPEAELTRRRGEVIDLLRSEARLLDMGTKISALFDADALPRMVRIIREISGAMKEAK